MSEIGGKLVESVFPKVQDDEDDQFTHEETRKKNPE